MLYPYMRLRSHKIFRQIVYTSFEIHSIQCERRTGRQKVLCQKIFLIFEDHLRAQRVLELIHGIPRRCCPHRRCHPDTTLSSSLRSGHKASIRQAFEGRGTPRSPAAPPAPPWTDLYRTRFSIPEAQAGVCYTPICA